MTRNRLLWLVVALASSAGAYMVRPVMVAPATYEDTNEPLFASFTDPSMATSLEVRTWDSKDAQLSAFKVEMQDGLWVIPSHHNYPADGVEQMGKSAASFVGLRKDIVRSDDVREHGEFGVKDPDNNDAKDEERGQPIILKDAQERGR